MRFLMSLRWIWYVAPKPPKGRVAQKRQNGRFPCKIALRTSLEKKSATKFLCVKTISDKVVRYSLA